MITSSISEPSQGPADLQHNAQRDNNVTVRPQQIIGHSLNEADELSQRILRATHQRCILNISTGAKVKAVPENGEQCTLQFEDGSSITVKLANPGASVAVRDRSNAVEYLG